MLKFSTYEAFTAFTDNLYLFCTSFLPLERFFMPPFRSLFSKPVSHKFVHLFLQVKLCWFLVFPSRLFPRFLKYENGDFLKGPELPIQIWLNWMNDADSYYKLYSCLYIKILFFCNSWYCSHTSSLAFTKNCRSFWCWSAIQPFAPLPHFLKHIFLYTYRFLHLFLGNCILFLLDCVSNLSRSFLTLILSFHITASPLTVSRYPQI